MKRRGRGRCGSSQPEGPDPERQASLRVLRQAPGVGPSIAEDLWELGVRSLEQLAKEDPEALYLRHCDHEGAKVDRCWLYVARCAVYFAGRRRHDPEKLKWWAWKDPP